MTDLPAPPSRLAMRLHLARAALFWERVWPAMWPALCVIGAFIIVALFDLFATLPGWLHAVLLVGFAVALIAAGYWGIHGVRSAAPTDRLAARRRIEQASGLSHRPLAALADQPSAPLDVAAAALWQAHQRRMAEAAKRLRIGWPIAGLARRDPWGVRSVLAILLILAGIDAGKDWADRLARAFAPGIYGGSAALAASFDLWLTPPDYTGLPPQFLKAGVKDPVEVPTGSALLAQVHGVGAIPRLKVDGDGKDFEAVDKQNFRLQTTLKTGRELSLSQGSTVLGQWPISVIPDNPPTIAFAKTPQSTTRAALRIDYHAGDDYGVESVKAIVTRPGNGANDKIELDLPLPGMHLKDAAATSYHDLAAHPWAGLPVDIKLVASDALGQTGESEPMHLTLPERQFRNPVAKAIIDQRKELAKDANSAPAVSEILGDLNSRPAIYGDDAVVFLALRMTQQQLRQVPDKATLGSIEQLLWDTALRIEDGHMSVAERDLRRLQQQLQDALAKGAPDAEIEKLMQEMRQAMDRYLQDLAQQQRQHPDEQNQQSVDPSKVITGRDLQRMLDRARDLARSGARDQAREMLSQLQNMMENMRMASPGQMQQQQQGASQAQQMMRGLQQMMQQQQRLLDRSFRAQNQMGRPNGNGRPGPQPQGQQPQGQQPGQQPGQQSPGQEPGDQAGQEAGGDQADSGEMGDAAGQQEGLRRSLGEMMRRLGDGMGDIPEPFGRAERAMRDAAGALQHGHPSQAIPSQTEALDQLQQAARDFAQQMQKQLGNSSGEPNNDESGGNNQSSGERSDRDPFGRPLSNDGTVDQGDVRIPEAGLLQKSRQILDELRRRAGDRSRPEIELDYIDRLLKRF